MALKPTSMIKAHGQLSGPFPDRKMLKFEVLISSNVLSFMTGLLLEDNNVQYQYHVTIILNKVTTYLFFLIYSLLKNSFW